MRYLDVGTSTRISRIGLGTWQFGSREWGYGPAAADLDLTDDEYQALSTAADRFRPVTGRAALPRLLRARFT